MIEPPRVLLWDIDGTLIDTTGLITAALDQIYRVFLNRTLPEDELRAIIGIPLSDQVRIFGDPESLGLSADSMKSEFIRFYESNPHMERVVPGAVNALVCARKAGRLTALVTSKNRAEIANTLPRLGILPFVDVVISADDVTNPKPDPEGVLAALRNLGASSDEAVFIGDTVHDLRAGRAAGVRRVAVTWGAGPLALLLAESPEFVCHHPDQLLSIFGI